MDFDALKELAHTINRNKVKKIEIIGNPGNSDTLTEMLYRGIIKGEFTSDEAAVQAFYETDDVSDSRYRRVRYRLIRQLLQTSLFVDRNQPAFTERVKAYHQCYCDYAAANILYMRNAKKPATWFMEQTLNQAIKFEFIDLCVDTTKFLKMYNNVLNPKKYAYYSEQHQFYTGQQQREAYAANCYNQLVHYYVSKRSPNAEIHQLASQFYAELEKFKTEKNTIQARYYTYQVGIIKHLAINDNAGALALSTEIIGIMNADKNANQSAKVGLFVQRLVCQTQLRQFEDTGGKASFQYGIKISEEGTFNWFRLYEFYFHHCLHARRYDEAWKIFTEAYQYPGFSKLQGAVRDNWHLYGGYCHLLALFGKFDAAAVESLVGKFRYARFINNFDIFDHDKTAMNIPLVILPLVYSIANGTAGEEYLSLDALDKYRKRHLDKHLNARSIAFINLLVLLISHPFEQKNMSEKIKKNLTVLQKEQLQTSRQTVAIEIIPYEDLWEMMTG
jgi:hypothetical protein